MRKPTIQSASVKRVWEMVLEEPYRVFFPLGILAGMGGVLLWPLFYGGHLGYYPGEAHARIMTGGFMGAFVAGFLGTAFPQLAGARRWMAGEFGTILLCWLLMVGAWLRGRVAAGDEAFAMMLVLLLAGMAVRSLRRRHDIPPPGFLLVFAGLVGAALSALWLARGTFVSVEWWKFVRLWYHQGFLLLPMMGIGPYLLPRFFGMPSGHSFETSVKAPAGWWRRAVASMIAGLCVITSFALEAWGWALVGQMLRALVVLGWFAMETPILRRALQRTTAGNAVRWALVSMAAGLACSALWPLTRIGSLHLFFVSGLGLMTLAVGSRVILGHAGRHDLLGGKIAWLRWVIGLALLAAMTRMTSDFIPEVRVSHHIYAAWSWVAAALVWLVAVWKYLWSSEQEQQPASNCPRRSAAKRVSGPT